MLNFTHYPYWKLLEALTRNKSSYQKTKYTIYKNVVEALEREIKKRDMRL